MGNLVVVKKLHRWSQMWSSLGDMYICDDCDVLATEPGDWDDCRGPFTEVPWATS